jgi:hypothetical protein
MRRVSRGPATLGAAALLTAASTAGLWQHGATRAGAHQPLSPPMTSDPPAAAGTSAGGTPEDRLPGAPPFPPDLLARLRAKWAGRDPSYKPRTRHLDPDWLTPLRTRCTSRPCG